MSTEIFENQWEKLPFRDTIHLSRKLVLVVWRDEQFVECYYQLAEFLQEKDDKKHYKVIAGFIYLTHLLQYLNTGINIDNYY